MMRNVISIIFLLCVACSIKVNGQIKTQDLLRLSKSYYLSLQKFSITVETKFKNAINVDTTLWYETHLIDHVRNVKFFKGTSSVFAKVGSEEYYIKPDNTFFHFVHNKKFTAYAQEYRHLPFVAPVAFFNKIEGESFLKDAKITESDSTRSLVFSSQRYTSKSIEFRKTDYSIRSITEIIYDQLNKGLQSNHIVFGPALDLTASEEEEINNMLSVIKNPANEAIVVKEEMPRAIDRSFLESSLRQVKNGNIESLENKTVFLDFFYQGCYPCVKSYPYVNELHKKKRQDIVVVGIDYPAHDSATIDKYIDKYDLQYPILVGEKALDAAKFFKLHGVPAFAIIEPNGEIVAIKIGFTKGSFKKFTKSLSKPTR